jgi:hypothetical protein
MGRIAVLLLIAKERVKMNKLYETEDLYLFLQISKPVFLEMCVTSESECATKRFYTCETLFKIDYSWYVFLSNYCFLDKIHICVIFVIFWTLWV